MPVMLTAMWLCSAMGARAQAPGVMPNSAVAPPASPKVGKRGAKQSGTDDDVLVFGLEEAEGKPPAPAATGAAGKLPPAPEAREAKASRPARVRAVASSKKAPKVATVKKRRGREPTPAYQKLRDSWHAPVEPGLLPALAVTVRRPLVLSQVNGGMLVTLVPQREDGGFSDEDLQRAAQAFAPRDWTGPVHPIAPRLLDLVYKAVLHFNAPMVHVVSGYRKDRAGSRHTQGRAVDMVLPGTTNEDLAEYVRSFGFCGVGVYPTSGFVHLDVRERSYFWVDNSLPGERSRSVPHMAEEAAEADRLAAMRGIQPDVFVPDNNKEDRAAAGSYARRAKRRRERAQKQLAVANAGASSRTATAAEPATARKQQRVALPNRDANATAVNRTKRAPNDAVAPTKSKPAHRRFDSASMFGGLPP